MGLLNDAYDATDRAMTAHEQKRRAESQTKAVAKQKAKQVANNKKKSGSSDSLF